MAQHPAPRPSSRGDHAGAGDDIGDAISDAFVGATNMFPFLDNGVVTDGCQVSWLGVEGSEQFEVVKPNLSIGTGVGACLPLNVAFCNTIRTTLNTRNGRGRIYTSGISSAAIDDTRVNSLAPGAADAFAATWDAVRGTIDAQTDFKLGVLSRYDGVDPDGKPILRPAGVFTAAVKVVSRNARLDSMRSRLKSAGS